MKIRDRIKSLRRVKASELIAAEQLGRKCFGLEISCAYVDVIVERWQNLTGEKATRCS